MTNIGRSAALLNAQSCLVGGVPAGGLAATPLVAGSCVRRIRHLPALQHVKSGQIDLLASQGQGAYNQMLSSIEESLTMQAGGRQTWLTSLRDACRTPCMR